MRKKKYSQTTPEEQEERSRNLQVIQSFGNVFEMFKPLWNLGNVMKTVERMPWIRKVVIKATVERCFDENKMIQQFSSLINV
jgi:hypothetical protein